VIGEALHRQLQAGVTTVRDLGDHRWAVIERRRRVATPAIVASGPPVTTRRGHCWQFGGEAAGPAALRAAVAERVERGADVVKVMLSGGAFTPHRDLLRSQFSRTGLGTLTGRAHTAGLPVTAHAHGVSAIEQAIDAGVDGIEHCGCLTESGIGGTDALLESLAARRIAVCPTLGSRDGTQPPAEVRQILDGLGLGPDQRLRNVGRMHAAGVRIVSGSDAGTSSAKPHGVLREAIADLVTAGVPGAAALTSATSVAAEVCGVAQRKGRLRAGLDADLLVVNGDPVRDIGALRRVAAVLAGGRWVIRTAEPAFAGSAAPVH
jgi:imidazolonepropionase-like amidohydrolase